MAEKPLVGTTRRPGWRFWMAVVFLGPIALVVSALRIGGEAVEGDDA